MRSLFLALALAAPLAAQPSADTFRSVAFVSQDQKLPADALVGTYATSRAALRVSPFGNDLVLVPMGQAALDVFANMAADASLNGRSEALLRAAFAGHLDRLAEALPARRRDAGTQDFVRMLDALTDQRGEATNVIALGTTSEAEDRAATLVRVTFDEGDELLKLVWRSGDLALITRGVLPQFVAQAIPGEQRYAVVDDDSVRALATFDGERITLQSAAGTFTAVRTR